MIEKKAIVTQILESTINWSKYPPLNKYHVNRDRAYYILHIVDKELNIKQLSASEIADILTKKFRKTTSPQAIRAALNPMIGQDIEVNERKDKVLVYTLLPEALSKIGISHEIIDNNFNTDEVVIPSEIFEKQKEYIKKCLLEVNGCYRDSYYTACSIMLRRLFETLIIEIYEKKKIENKIKDLEDNYIKLNALIKKIINEKEIKLSSQTKNHLQKIKLFGDAGAHSRKIILRKHDIDVYKDEIRLSAEDLVSDLNQ